MLSQSRSRSIGVLVPSVTNHVFADVLAGIIDEAAASDYRAMILHYGYDSLLEERCVATLLAHNIDGLVMSDRDHTPAALRMIGASGIDVVEIMDTRLPALQQAVGYDNHAASFEIVSEMIAAGHEKIVYFAVRLDERTRQREEGYREAMEHHGLTPITLERAQKSSFTVGATLMAELLETRPDTQGVFCTNDDVAVGASFECRHRGAAIVDQVMIAGFHGLDVGQAMRPGLASVLTPRYRIGQVATRELLSRINGAEMESDVVDLGYTIVNLPRSGASETRKALASENPLVFTGG
ncbi:MAG: substrate-binding domain-containing protein [Paracoccus sp. (in: a-proteobacteria)]|nr:substrate-binding domain-containing protein [Paracoccus sp. (in: a-proteobacteria)]